MLIHVDCDNVRFQILNEILNVLQNEERKLFYSIQEAILEAKIQIYGHPQQALSNYIKEDIIRKLIIDPIKSNKNVITTVKKNKHNLFGNKLLSWEDKELWKQFSILIQKIIQEEYDEELVKRAIEACMAKKVWEEVGKKSATEVTQQYSDKLLKNCNSLENKNKLKTELQKIANTVVSNKKWSNLYFIVGSGLFAVLVSPLAFFVVSRLALMFELELGLLNSAAGSMTGLVFVGLMSYTHATYQKNSLQKIIDNLVSLSIEKENDKTFEIKTRHKPKLDASNRKYEKRKSLENSSNLITSSVEDTKVEDLTSTSKVVTKKIKRKDKVKSEEEEIQVEDKKIEPPIGIQIVNQPDAEAFKWQEKSAQARLYSSENGTIILRPTGTGKDYAFFFKGSRTEEFILDPKNSEKASKKAAANLGKEGYKEEGYWKFFDNTRVYPKNENPLVNDAGNTLLIMRKKPGKHGKL